MKFLNKLERMLGRFAIPNVMKYVAGMFILGIVLGVVPNYSVYQLLALDFNLIRQGQIWRLITFIIPITGIQDLFWTIIGAYFYYLIGNELERVWGAFRLNLYLLSGILFNLLSSFILYQAVGITLSPSIEVVCGTLFFAFAAVYPNALLQMYFIIPVKAKYLAMIRGALYLYNVIIFIMFGQYFFIIPTVVSFANFFIFFFATRNYRRISPNEIKRRAKFKRQMQEGKGYGTVIQFNGRNVVARHRCAVCGRTELDDEQLEFRFCSKCEGNYEYCMDHLFTHEHVKNNNP